MGLFTFSKSDGGATQTFDFQFLHMRQNNTKDWPEFQKVSLDSNISNLMNSSQQEYASFYAASSMNNSQLKGVVEKIPTIVEEYDRLYGTTLKQIQGKVKQLHDLRRQLRQMEENDED